MERVFENTKDSIRLIKYTDTYELQEEGNLALTKSTEVYEVDFKDDVDAMIEGGLRSSDFNLVGHAEKFKQAKYKKDELVKDEYFQVTLKKEF